MHQGKTGIAELLQTAVEPLTNHRGYCIETIQFGTYYGDTKILLRLENLRILFSCTLKDYRGAHLWFIKTAMGKDFSAEYLFPAIGFNSLLSPKTRTRIEYRAQGYPDAINELLEGIDFIEEVSRLSSIIDEHYPQLMDALGPAIDETTRKYEMVQTKREGTMKAVEYVPREDENLPIPEPISISINRNSSRGKIEDIREAIRPILTICSEILIYYHPWNDTVDVLCIGVRNSAWDLLFHSEKGGSVGIYFTLRPIHPFIPGRVELMKENRWIVFAGRNLFKYLGITFTNEPKGYLADIAKISSFIHDNAMKILAASSREHVEQTYRSLQTMSGNNEQEIQNVILHLV